MAEVFFSRGWQYRLLDLDRFSLRIESLFPDSSLGSIIARDKALRATDEEILEAVKRAKAYRLCLRRIWAVAANLPDKVNNLPGLIPPPGMFSVPSHGRQYHDHEQCTFDFCEYSRVDFTSVEQHHEDCRKDCSHIRFPLQMLDERVMKGEPTAWKLDEPSLLSTSQAYMAVSHVWADGTGAGAWGPGKVNKCLYTFFCKIARHFECEGCWWDTISIPQGDELRAQALNNMQNTYADARVTLVHDLYLRDWEWVDAETACFAIVMSPWYSRGWTSLELTRSHKVKILFKAKNDQFVIKDLDIDILAAVPASSRHHPTAEAIGKLRSASIQNFSDLLAVLGPRDTSKPRDIPIISGLLAGVDVSGGLSQQEIYQRILRKLGKVAQGHLFHNSATMSMPGFSWCPTNILDMPMATESSAWLEIRENGDLEGAWKVYGCGPITPKDIIWKGTHPLTEVSLRSALKDENKKDYVLLVENGDKITRALLVKLARNRQEAPILCCHFVGPVYFLKALGHDFREMIVRIGSTDGMEDLQQDAWEFVCSMVQPEKVVKGTSPMSKGSPAFSEFFTRKSKKATGHGLLENIESKDWRAIYYSDVAMTSSLFANSEMLHIQRSKTPEKSEEMELYFLNDDTGEESNGSYYSFFYGHKAIIRYVKGWLEQNGRHATKQMILLVLNQDDEIYIETDDTLTKNDLASDALLLAAEKGKKRGVEDLVTLLLDNGAQHKPNASKQTPLYLAVEHGAVATVKSLLSNKSNPASVDVVNGKVQTQSVIHIAAKKGFEEIFGLLAENSDSLDDRELQTEKTALHLAAERGNDKIARILLDKGANTNLPDQKGQIPLHYAASGGHKYIVDALLNNHDKQRSGKSSQLTVDHDYDNLGDVSGGEVDGKSERAFEENTNADGDVNSFEKNHEKTRLELQKDKHGRTALHLAAQKGHDAVVEVLIRHGAKVGDKDKDGKTALLLAAMSGNADIVGRLFATDPTGFDQAELGEALLLAAKGTHEEVVTKLHQGGARSGLQDSEGKTALHWTIESRDEENTRLLVGTQEDLNLTTKNEQQSALMLAADKGLKDAVAQLLNSNAKADLKDSEKRTALHWAVMKRNVEIIKLLIALSSQELLNAKDSLGRTALHWAARSGSSKATGLLLGVGAHHANQDNDGRSALMLAAGNGHAAAAEKLLQYGTPAKTRDKDEMSALDWAAISGSQKVVRVILPEIEEDESKTKALGLAAEGGHLSVATMLLEDIKDAHTRASALPVVLFSAASTRESVSAAYKSEIDKLFENATDPNQQDKEGKTALILAVMNGNLRFANRLLTLNTDVDLQDNNGTTALMRATMFGYREIVVALLKKGAKTDVLDKKGFSAVHYAAISSSAVLLALLQNKADPNLRGRHGYTPLHYALFLGDHQLRIASRPWRVLLDYGAEPDIQDEEGKTPLHWAVKKNQPGIAKRLLRYRKRLDLKDNDGRTPLFLAAAYGRTTLAIALLEVGSDPNTQDVAKQTPLLLASGKGLHELVDELLKKGADPNIADHQGRTALSQAAQNGHDIVVSLLLNTQSVKINFDVRDAAGRTALLLAAENGHANIVKHLLEHKANSAIMDYDGKKAWQKAMDEGHASIVDSLLSDPHAPLQDREAVNEALLLASRRGWVPLVKVLLQKEADASFQSPEGWTALHMAVMKGHQEVVKILLMRGTNIIIKDSKGRTVLMQATEHGFESIVSLLLGQPEVKADVDGWMGKEALSLAAEKGDLGIVKLLIDNKVNCDEAVESMGRTPIALAAANGNKDIVELLLKEKASPGAVDGYNRTALHHAAWGGHKDVVEILLEHGADFSASDIRGQSALHLAAERASESVIERLLEKRANVNARSRDGQTALHRAAWGGSKNVVTLLRKNGADPFIRDRFENKPWQIATVKGHESIASILLEEEESVNEERIMNKHALIFVAKMGYATIARSLLAKGADSSVKDKDGLTPLHWATAQGNKELVSLLIENGAESINALDSQKRTAICHGVKEDRAAVVELLLQSGANADIADDQGDTPLHYAARSGNWEIVQILIVKAYPHARNKKKEKAWQLAAEGGHHQIARLLLEKEVYQDSRSQKMEELLLKMAEKGVVPMVQLLLEKGVDMNVKDQLGRTAIGLAAEHKRNEVLGLLLSKGANRQIPDLKGQTPLLWAAKTGNAKMISLLLDKTNTSQVVSEAGSSTSYNGEKSSNGAPAPATATEDTVQHVEGHEAKTSTATNEYNASINTAIAAGASLAAATATLAAATTAAMTAIVPGTVTAADAAAAVDTVLHSEDKAKMVNYPDLEGRTALLVAVEMKSDNAVRVLLDKGSPGIDVDVQDVTGRTALHLAARQGNKELVKLLLKRQAKQTLSDELGCTALFLAIEKSEETVATILLESSEESVNISDKKGRTALQMATERGNKAMVETLLHKGADPNHADDLGRTPLFLAAENGYREIVDLLLKKKAKQDLKDLAGRTPLLLAVANGDEAIVRALLDHPNVDLTIKGPHDRSLHELAFESGNREVLWLLEQRRAKDRNK